MIVYSSLCYKVVVVVLLLKLDAYDEEGEDRLENVKRHYLFVGLQLQKTLIAFVCSLLNGSYDFKTHFKSSLTYNIYIYI